MTDLWLWAWVPVLIAVASAEHLAESRTSAAERYLRWPNNLSLFFIEIALASALTALLALSAAATLLPIPALITLSAQPLPIAFTGWLLVSTFTVYWLHRLSHKIPLIWRAHRVHHCDPIVDPSTALRHHPVEIVLALAAFQIPFALFRPAPEHVLLIGIIERCFSAATHTGLRLPVRLERWLGLVFVTPLQHLTHHSDFQPETDSNYGSVLNIWDRLFGTFLARPLRPDAAFRAGLAEVPADKAANVLAMLVLPALGKDPWRAGRQGLTAPTGPQPPQ